MQCSKQLRANMGWGDEIMVTGEVKRRAAGTVRRFAILNRADKHRWHEIWEGNPRIARPGESFDEELKNCGGHRPYIKATDSDRFAWQPYAPEPGEIFLTEEERLYGRQGGGVLLQPHLKSAASPNKDWGVERWQRLVALAPHIRWVQIGEPGTKRLRGVRFIETGSFRKACAVLAFSRAAVLQEGGMHHAAAALGVPAVVIFGGFISPAVTGYPAQRNLFTGTGLGCGWRIKCKCCAQAMAAIEPGRVLTELEASLEEHRRGVAA